MTDEQFESKMAAFAKKLETHCNEAVAKHARKMRPNYDGQWIFELKARMLRFNAQKQASSKSETKDDGKH